MNKSPKVFFIILNYNGKQTILSCLKSVFQSHYANFEVVVVDNNSTDGSFELAKQAFSKAHFIKIEKNLGFASGNNIGIRFALEKFADYVFVLNNDAYLQKDTLPLLIETAEKKKNIGIISPLILDRKEKVWFSKGKINWFKMKTVHTNSKPGNDLIQTEYVTGCAMLIKKDVFKKIGLFDEKFFLYYEDADFSIRAKRAGFSLFVFPKTKIIHDEQSNSDNAQKIYWLVVSGLLFFKKNTPYFLKPWLFVYLQLRKLKNLFSLILTKNSIASEVHRAYKDFKTTY